jgi:UDP-glucuronate decarboxylase
MDTADDFIGPVNIGNPNEFTILELAEKIIDLTGSRSRIDSKPLPSDDPIQRKPDISLAREKLDWEPKTPVDEGLKRTIHYFEKLLQRKSAT